MSDPLTNPSTEPTYKTQVAIVGSGPAGHTAGIYTSRAMLDPILFEGEMDGNSIPGGQLTTTTEVENFPGYTTIGGFELTQKFREQSEHYGTKVVSEKIVKVDLTNGRPFKLWTSSNKLVQADSVIVATGAYAKTLNFPGMKEFWNKGISACATCDGALPMFRKKPLAVIGGGDSAMEEALFLSRYGSKVYIIVRRSELRASKIMAIRAQKKENIEFLWNTVTVEAVGEKKLQRIKIQSTLPDNKEVRDLEVNGLFFAIGHQPFTDIFKGQLDLDSEGYINVKPGKCETNIDGVFACGDVMDKEWRQAITSAGTGCVAALQAQRYLEAQELDNKNE
uniref:Thioredoxin reductase n=1 Tax=Percolomonas cosmopolitus TaxID=63605 RepID=A0A6U0KHV6_9EUKA|mmetsp:Transcript_3784/g.14361  ORF Transcript_3784/g.14361 Transcript_3784/m.14361 type:complete len:336 (+) Transcript_3784:86-1093(+)|eukprot:CAMPEP_0117443082 /NCGR_PEP_ID=MMETSP0759-20121206/4502_1 /TAXON_ID=63605 /ORGANISM="Percolomonas cosmopolitus, Strain WS" /LENGTH=335 /DNA_ID=CAMNT_0005235027 /DNA_START=5470 /DNA_END=6477 /DNA_ORIENTATION=+